MEESTLKRKTLPIYYVYATNVSVIKMWNVTKLKFQSCHVNALKLQTSYLQDAYHVQLCANKH